MSRNDVTTTAGSDHEVTVHLGNGRKLTGHAKEIEVGGRMCLLVVCEDEPYIIPFPIQDVKFPRLAGAYQ